MESKHMYKVYSLDINGHTDTDTRKKERKICACGPVQKRHDKVTEFHAVYHTAAPNIAHLLSLELLDNLVTIFDHV